MQAKKVHYYRPTLNDLSGYYLERLFFFRKKFKKLPFFNLKVYYIVKEDDPYAFN